MDSMAIGVILVLLGGVGLGLVWAGMLRSIPKDRD